MWSPVLYEPESIRIHAHHGHIYATMSRVHTDFGVLNPRHTFCQKRACSLIAALSGSTGEQTSTLDLLCDNTCRGSRTGNTRNSSDQSLSRCLLRVQLGRLRMSVSKASEGSTAQEHRRFQRLWGSNPQDKNLHSRVMR